VVEGLLANWDDAVADRLFAMNVDLDLPRALRREAVAKSVDAVGGPLRRDDTARPHAHPTPAELEWWLRGERGWVRVRILATPEPAPTIQTLELTTVLDPSPALVDTATALLAAAAVGPDLAHGVDLATSFDADAWARGAQAAGARFGGMSLGLPKAGDGTKTATWGLRTDRGEGLELSLSLDAETGAVAQAALRIAKREAPPEGW
jgi:hypothetical protein